jgi:hypothetical protein
MPKCRRTHRGCGRLLSVAPGIAATAAAPPSQKPCTFGIGKALEAIQVASQTGGK